MRTGGGVITLKLGKDKPANFNEILDILKRIVDGGEHFLVSVCDTEYNKFLGDCEVIWSDDRTTYTISQGRIDADGLVTEYHYYFRTDGVYIKNTQFYNIKKMQSKITELENKLNKITQTE